VPERRVTRYRQAALDAREKAKTAIDPKQWEHIADAWDLLARHVELWISPERHQGCTERLRGDDADQT
jgi:hypothetical protein